MAMSIVAYVGIDAHDASLSICVLDPTNSDQPLRYKIANDPEEIRRTFGRLVTRFELRCCYEASSLGYVLQRQLTKMGVPCDVIAPSLIPKRPGDRIKTDRRDAFKLATLYKAGQLTVVHPPTPEQEAVRRVTRLREQIVREIVASKNELNRFLGSLGRSFPGKSRWTQAYWKWLGEQRFDADDQFVFDQMVALLQYKLSRLAEVDSRIERIAASDSYKELVGKLCCLRGFGLVTAMTLIAEVIDFHRFPTATALMSYLGLIPSEHSSGNSRRQGRITKCGNARCRRVLVEAAWKYSHKPALGAGLKLRQKEQPAAVVAHAWKAQNRLHHKFTSVSGRKPRPVAAVAVARELIGFVWAIMVG